MKNPQNLKNNSNYSGVFNYFDEGFYQFLTLTSKSKICKKIRFRSKKSYIITPEQAMKIKNYIDTVGIKYKGNKLNRIFLQNPQSIQNILTYK